MKIKHLFIEIKFIKCYIQFFTGNPRGSKAKAIDPSDINACSAEESIRKFAMEIMKDDLDRMEYLPYSFYNFHPGSHVKQGSEKGIEYIVNMLNTVLRAEQTTTLLL